MPFSKLITKQFKNVVFYHLNAKKAKTKTYKPNTKTENICVHEIKEEEEENEAKEAKQNL